LVGSGGGPVVPGEVRWGLVVVKWGPVVVRWGPVVVLL
jgi:hypothetical protein